MIQDIYKLHWNIIHKSTGVTWNVGPYKLIRLPGHPNLDVDVDTLMLLKTSLWLSSDSKYWWRLQVETARLLRISSKSNCRDFVELCGWHVTVYVPLLTYLADKKSYILHAFAVNESTQNLHRFNSVLKNYSCLTVSCEKVKRQLLLTRPSLQVKRLYLYWLFVYNTDHHFYVIPTQCFSNETDLIWIISRISWRTMLLFFMILTTKKNVDLIIPVNTIKLWYKSDVLLQSLYSVYILKNYYRACIVYILKNYYRACIVYIQKNMRDKLHVIRNSKKSASSNSPTLIK